MADITKTIVPRYTESKIPYRYPDNLTSPALALEDYFYTPEEKTFIFMSTPGEKTFVTIDFFGLDNSFFDGEKFRTA